MAAARRPSRSQAGQGTVEYLGMAAAAAALVVLLVAVAPDAGGSLAAFLRSAVCNVLGSGCPAPGTATAGRTFEPSSCERSSRTTEGGGSLRVAFVELGADYTFVRSEDSDGVTTLTFVDGSGVAAVAGVGGKVELEAGGRSYGGQARASAELGIVASRGDTWRFLTPDDADDFEAWIRREKNEDRRGGMLPGYGSLNSLGEWVNGEEDLPDPTITFVEGGVQGRAGGSLGYGGATAEVEASGALVLGAEVDRASRRTSTYYQVDLGAGGEGNALFAGFGASWAGSGVVKVTRNQAEDIVSVEIVDTSAGTLEGLAGLDSDRLTMAGLMKELAREASATVGSSDASVGTIVSTTTLEVTDRDRAVVEGWVGLLDLTAGAAERAVDGGLPDREEDVASPFGRLLFDRATVSVVEYAGERSGLALEAEVALGAKLGVDIGSTEASSRAVDAWYLAGSEGGRRVLVPFTACVDRR